MWHLHAGSPERCLEQSERRDDLARRAASMPNAILCEANISTEQCAEILANLVKRRAEERGEKPS